MKAGAWHIHSEHSLLDGLGKIEEYVIRVKELGLAGCAFSDHGTLSGAYQQWQAGKKHGVTVAIGCEFYFAPEGASVKEAVNWGELEGKKSPGRYTHMCLYAMNAEGVRNLYRLQADAYEHGFYYKPRVDIEMLAKYSEGIIATTGCMGSVTSTWIRLGEMDKATEHASELKQIYGDRLYAEVMEHGVPGEKELNDGIVKMAESLDIPLLQTMDAHYVLQEDHDSHAAFLCCQTNTTMADPKRFQFSGDPTYHIKSYDEMIASSLPESATINSAELFDRIDFASYSEVLDPGTLMPTWGIEDEDEALRLLTDEGMAEKLDDEDWRTNFPEYAKRIDDDLQIIIDGGYEGYFVALHYLMKEARRRGIIFGPGRGSSSGCLPAAALGITNVDSIKHNLIMERFLNPKRKSLPDVDTDVAEHQRQEYIDLAVEMMGENNVAVIGTFGTIGARAALEKAGKVLGKTYAEQTEYKSYLPNAIFGVAPTLDKYTGPKDEVYELACKFEGLIQTQSQHAAGIIFSPVDLRSRVPLWKKQGKGHWVTSFTMGEVEATGNVKMDFLGLSNLTILDNALRWSGVKWEDLPVLPEDCNDQRVYNKLSQGSSMGVFQLDSNTGKRTLKKVRPQNFMELADVLALVRPGAMEHIDEYASRHGKMQPSWRFHPELDKLDPILESSKGVLLMQEQVLECLNVICGWDYGDADLVLGALRKKKHDKLAEAKPQYIEDGKKNGYSEEALEEFWQILLPFADYSFAAAHARAYALISYWTGWLLVNHPNEYYAALLTANHDDQDKLTACLEDARLNGVTILPPDINESDYGFTPTKKGIRFGLSAIKGVGESMVSKLKDSHIHSLEDFYARIPDGLNTKSLQCFIRAGALDSLGDRVAHNEKSELWLTKAKELKKAEVGTPKTLGGNRPIVKPKYSLPQSQADKHTMRIWEEELLGSSLTQLGLSVRLKRPLTEDEWGWLSVKLSDYPGEERVKFMLNGTTFTGQGVDACDKLVTSLKLIDAIEPEVD